MAPQICTFSLDLCPELYNDTSVDSQVSQVNLLQRELLVPPSPHPSLFLFQAALCQKKASRSTQLLMPKIEKFPRSLSFIFLFACRVYVHETSNPFSTGITPLATQVQAISFCFTIALSVQLVSLIPILSPFCKPTTVTS